MINNKFYPVFIFAILIFLNACNFNKDQVTISQTNFKEYVEQNMNLEFTFTNEIADESELNKWTNKQFLTIEPPIQGQFQWKKKNLLVFSPNREMKNNSKYTVTLNQIEFEDKNLKVNKEFSRSFISKPLEITGSNISWFLKSNTTDKAELRAKVVFNREIKPESFNDLITVSISGEELDAAVINNTYGNSLEFKIFNNNYYKNNEEVKISIKPLYQLINSENNNNKKLMVSNNVPTPGQLVINGIDVFHNGTLGEVQVNTNQNININNLRSFIEIEPKIEYEIEPNSNGFKITSNNFSIDVAYNIKLSEKIKGVFNTPLANEYIKEFTFGELDASINIPDQRSQYLNSKGNKNIAVEIVSIDEVEVKLYKVFANNIKSLFKNGKSYKYERHYNKKKKYYEYENYEQYDLQELGKLIYNNKIKTDQLSVIGKVKLLNLDFDDLLNDHSGLYVLEVNHPDKRYITSSTIISMSDIGIITKESDNAYHVFINSINSTNAIAGAEVTLVDITNEELISRTTDGDGVAIFYKNEIEMIDPQAEMVYVKNGDDFNSLILNRTGINNSRFEIGGLRNHNSNYQAYMYAERELYRPGETVNIAAIIRDNDLNSPKNIPFVIKCLLPNGKLFKTINKKVDENGSLSCSVKFSAKSITGSYQFEIYTGNGIFVTSKNIKVEEFMPDRINVKTEVDKRDYTNGDEINLDLSAVNFFGPPAKDRNYEVEFSISNSRFYAKDFSQYNFYNRANITFEKELSANKTDKEGKAAVTFKIPEVLKDNGVLQGNIYSTVFDETGRPVSRNNKFKIYTQDVFYGLKYTSYYRDINEKLPLQFIALDKDQNLLDNEPMHLKIVRNYYRYVLEKNSRGKYRYKSYRQEDVVLEKNITLSGEETIYDFYPEESGRYKVYFGKEGSLGEAKFHFYAYDRNRTSYNSFEVNREGKIDFIQNQDSYNVGDQAKLILTTPFDGKILVTIEQDNILQHFYTTTQNKSTEITIDITEEMNPNVYVTATLIKSIADNRSPLTIAYGIQNLNVINPGKIIDLSIDSETKIRSGKKYNFKINAEPNTSLTVAVVDEGILNITNYQSPDPYDHFYQKRALMVQSYDLYPYLFPELTDVGLLKGGGASDNLDKRSVGFGNKRIKLVSYWSDLVKTDENGEYEMEIDIPEFSGKLRVMAVAFNEDRFGAAQENIIVADPVVVSSGLPRFLSPGDEFDIPVTLSNTTEDELFNEVKILNNEMVDIIGRSDISANISANDEFQTAFKARVKNKLGDAKVNLSSYVKSLNETFNQNTTLVVRSAAPFEKRSGSGQVNADKEEEINIESDFIPESVDGHLTISKSPIIEFGDKLSYLIRYPHGCLEQTISKAFPMVYVEDLAKEINFDLSKSKTLDPYYLVQEAIYKVQTMQLSNGGLSYWQRSSNSYINWFASTYAAHFLTECKKAGYDVDDHVLDNLYDFLRSRMKSKETFSYRYFGNKVNKEYARKEIIYSLFVLALANQADIPLMNYYKSTPDLLSLDSKYMLGASYGLLGDMENFRKLIPSSFSGEKSIAEFDGSFSSFIRDLAISLYVLVEVDPDNIQIPEMARKLSKEYKERRYFNTQEAAFTLLGLGKYAQQLRNNSVNAQVIIDNELFADLGEDKQLQISYREFDENSLKIKTTGQGKLFYFWEISGISSDNFVEDKDHFLEVRKSFYDRNGKEVDLAKVKQNDLIVVKLSLRSKDKTVKNVALTDILPAGFEIENPRLSVSSNIDWQNNKGSYDHIDFRDDRVNIYTTAHPLRNNSYYNYYYTVRAVSKGTFAMGPASADAMYDGSYYSYNGAGKITIK